uniref:Uncharacterized protein n=1 Tax=Utricularia reniformis TaxID=192314 RepID=A0A1Y0AZG6_9LAMI|nr:hypothetical protein AEK19_MT0281 [Utricularia reniformis]ART30557.1 hypothetical protein AEK19_MT0281 [Utricularia reniformis]
MCDLLELILLIVQRIGLSPLYRWFYFVGYFVEYLEHELYEINSIKNYLNYDSYLIIIIRPRVRITKRMSNCLVWNSF